MTPRPKNQPREVPTSTLPRGPRLYVRGQGAPRGATREGQTHTWWPGGHKASLAVVLTGSDFVPGGHVPTPGDISGCHNGGRGSTQWVEAKNTATSHDALDSP